ncbi:MAG: DUF1697 domain-containing protein [Terriglobales bacterium]
MAWVAFLRGVNVGGHRRFPPSLLARELEGFDVVNIGAAGTLVARGAGSRARFKAELRRRLPFEAEVAICTSREIVDLVRRDPFAAVPLAAALTRFVTILVRGAPALPTPFALPETGPWLVRVLGCEGRFVFGVYRRHMKTIACLGQLDRSLGARGATRSWNTMRAVARALC